MEHDLSKLECIKCGHKWWPRNEDVLICPKCKTKFWASNESRKLKPYKKRK